MASRRVWLPLVLAALFALPASLCVRVISRALSDDASPLELVARCAECSGLDDCRERCGVLVSDKMKRGGPVEDPPLLDF